MKKMLIIMMCMFAVSSFAGGTCVTYDNGVTICW